ncbi:hypothetical protein N7481_011807, partial [Penicillium waksmanii]|uniref:uncharacterized protein n=1 Tax=Penicillium waksmanii TaxID=69791 RepID=UPI002546D010
GESKKKKRTKSSSRDRVYEDGSPSDSTPRTKLNVEDLDLEKSYVGIVDVCSMAERPEKPRRWKHRGPDPLTDELRLPKGWTSEEPDLDINDIDAQITRCLERLEDNIMPHIFQRRLEDYREAQALFREKTVGEQEGLSWKVIERITVLKDLEDCLQKEDQYEQLSNVQAILNAYRSQTLDWTGLVTYWSKGAQLCEPRPFDWDEFEAINQKHDGYKDFWVEGNQIPGPEGRLAMITVEERLRVNNRRTGINVWYYPQYQTAFRLPHYDWWDELEVIHDTGCSNLRFFQNDISIIAGPHRSGGDIPKVMTLGMITGVVANGQLVHEPAVEVEAVILSNRRRRMGPWVRVQAVLSPGRYIPGQNYRLDGRWLRTNYYTASAPDGTHRLYIASRKCDLTIPKVGFEQREVLVRNSPLASVTTSVGSAIQMSSPELALQGAAPRAWPKGGHRVPD